VRQHRQRDGECAEDVGLEHLAQGRGIDCLERTRDADAGIVDQHIDPLVCLQRAHRVGQTRERIPDQSLSYSR
jgi:hypothetical protein